MLHRGVLGAPQPLMSLVSYASDGISNSMLHFFKELNQQKALSLLHGRKDLLFGCPHPVSSGMDPY